MELLTLASSSSGNSALVSHNGTHLLIDAGISCKRIKQSLQCCGLELNDISAILVTHSHSDHIGGLKTLTKHSRARIFATDRTLEQLAPCVAEGTALEALVPGIVCEAGTMSFRAFKTSHDAPGSAGYVVEAGGRKLVFATDLGIVTPEVEENTLGADLALIESNHDLQMLKYGYYPPMLKRRIMSDVGHLSNLAGAELAVRLAKSGTRRIVLAHLSHDNNTPELAFECTRQRLQKANAVVGGDVELSVAPRDVTGELIAV